MFFKEKLFQKRKTLQDDFILIGFWNLVDRENNEFNGNQLLDEKKQVMPLVKFLERLIHSHSEPDVDVITEQTSFILALNLLVIAHGCTEVDHSVGIVGMHGTKP